MSSGGRHPDIEALACLAEGRCPPGEREELLEHLAACEICLEVYDGTLRALTGASVAEAPAEGIVSPGHSPTPPPAAGPRRKPGAGRGWPLMPIAAIAAVGILAAGLTVALQAFLGREASPGGLPALVEAVGPRRLIEPRLSGGFQYGPPPGPRRGPIRPPALPDAGLTSPRGDGREPVEVEPDHWDIISAAKRIRDQAGDGIGSLEEARSLAAALVLTGSAAEAVEVLRSGLERFGPGASALSDLAAAYLVQAASGQGAEPPEVLRVRALDAARHAAELDPALAEARFNLALALERQLRAAGGGGPAAAPVVEAWEEYIRVDPDSPWAGEAGRRIRDLESPGASWIPPRDERLLELARAGRPGRLAEALGEGPGRVRGVLERRALCRWSQACLDGDAAAASAELEAAALLAGTFQSATGDPYYTRVVEGLGRMAAPVQESATGLCSSVAALCAGLRRDGGLGLEEAAARIETSGRGLERAGSPLCWSSRLSAAIHLYYLGRPVESEERLTRILEAPEIGDYPMLEGLARWMRGTIRATRLDLAASLGDHARALSLFLEIGAMGHAASEHRLLAEVYGLLGRPAEGWRHREQALALAHLADADRRAALHLEAAYASLDLRLPWAALLMASRVPDGDEAIFQGTRLQAPLVRAEALEMAGRPGAAQEELERAAGRLEAPGEHAMLARYRAELDASRGRVLRGADPGAALETLQGALDFFAEEGREDPLLAARAPALLLAMGRIHRDMDRPEEARRALDRGIALLEEAVRRLEGTPYMISLADRAWELYDEMIGLQALALDDPHGALAYAQRARGARLGSRARSRGAAASGAGRIAGSVPAGSALVYFVSLEDHLLTWVIRDGEIHFRTSGTTRRELQERVDDLISARGAGRSGAPPAAAETLYEILVRPLEPHLAGAAEVRLLPGGDLGRLPFAVLRDAAGGRYLVEKWALSIVPGAGIPAQDPPERPGGGGVLVLGNPALAARWAQKLAPLPGAEGEARAVAALYRDATLLTGAEATPEAFLDRASGSRILHFAGHAVANERHPDRSALILAPGRDASSTGLLMAREIARASLPPGALVVLGGCRTATGRPSRTAGALSLARPFLAAGASQVIGTLWDLDDRAGREALVRLHVNLQREGSASLALQRTQRDLISEDDPALRSPATWGAFMLVGREPS